MFTLVTQSPRGYSLYQDQARHVLCVQCGSSNMYELCIALAPSDVQKVVEDRAHLDDIADRIMYDPDQFAPYSIPSPLI